MIENSADFLPIYMLLSAAFGFIAGDAFGNSTRHRKCLQQANENLHDALDKAQACQQPIEQQLKQQRSVINDIHSRLVAVSKALQNRPS